MRHQGASEGNEKLVWILIIVFTHWIGAAIDYFAEKISAAKQRQIAATACPEVKPKGRKPWEKKKNTKQAP